MEDDQPISKRKKDEPESGRENSRRTGANQAGKGQARPPSRKLSFVSDHNYDELLELGLCSKCGEGYHSGACGLNKECENDEYDASITPNKDDEGDAKPTSENLQSALQHHPDITDRDSYEELLKLGTEAVCGVPSHPLNFSNKVKAQRTHAKQCEADRNNDALRNLRQTTMRGQEESASTITTISITSGNASEMVNTALRNSLPGNELISETISSQNLFEDDVEVEKLSSVLNISQINSQEIGLEYENETVQLTGFSIESPTPTVKLVSTNQSLPKADGSGVFEEIETVSTEIVNIEREESANIIPETYLTSSPPDAEDFNSIEVEPVQSPTNASKSEMEESMTEEAVRTPNDEATNSEPQEMIPANSAEDAMSVTKVPNQPFHLKVTTDGEIQVACTKTSKNTVECTVTTQVTTKSSEMVRTSDAEIAITVIKHSTKPVTYSVPDVSTSATANNVSSNLVNQEETKPVSNIGSSSLETHEDEVLLAAVNSTSRFQVSDPIIHQTENEVVLASDSKPVTVDENQEEMQGSKGPSVNQLESSHAAPEIQLDEITIEVQQEDVKETEIEIFSTSDTENVVNVEFSDSTPTPEIQLAEITIEEQQEDVNETEIETFSTSKTENVANVEFSHSTPTQEIQLHEITIEEQQEDVMETEIVLSESDTDNVVNVEFSHSTPTQEIQLDEITIEEQQDVKETGIEIFSTSKTKNVANVELSHSTPTPEPQLEEIKVDNEAINETQVVPASEIDTQIVESSHDYPQEEQLEQFFMQSGEEEESNFSIMMNMDDIPPVPEPVKDSLSAQGIEQDLLNNKSENLQKSKSTHQNTNRPSPSDLNITEELPPATDAQNDVRGSGQLSIEKIPRNSEDILTLHEYNSEHFEPPETEMHNASTSVRTSYLLSRKSSPQANQPDVADESVSVRTSYLMSRKSSAQAIPADPADESLSVRTSYLMSKRSSVQATPVPVDVADESVSVRTSYLMSKGSSEEVGSTEIDDSFPDQLDTVVEQPIEISNTNLEQDNIPSLQPITTEVFDNLAPSKTIEIRPVQHNNTPAEQSGMLEIEEHKQTLNSITEDEASESHKEDLTNPNSRRTKRHKQRVKKGEGFLDLEYSLPAQETVSVVTFYETTSPSEVSEGEFENEETKEELRSRIIEQAEEIKSLISEKRMGLPQVHSDHILSLANEIISNHTKSINIFETDTQTQQQKSRKSKRQADKTDRHAQSIINIAERSKGILGKFQNTKEYKQSVPPGEATEHLSKMIKKLHCRHRKLRRLAEEIIAKRWKLMKLGSSSAPVQKSELPKTEGKGESALRKKSKPKSKAQKHLRKRARRKKIGKSKPAQMNTLKTLYTNPIARVKEVGVRSGKETWKEGDPLWKAVNKVGVEKVQKCSAHPPSTTLPPLILVGGSGSENELTEEQMNNMNRRKWNKNDGFSGLSIPGQGMSALSIFYSNLSRVTIKPSKTFVYDSKPGAPVRMGSIRLFNVDEAKLTNCFVDQWKRRSYGIGILSVILTALTHCVYMCGPRMGDNYVTYTMISRMSGHPLTAPTGIYGIIFLGYLFGGMTCIKTTAATATDSSVKDYFKKRKWKIIMWYVLAWYYFIIWVSRSISWFTGLEQTEQEIRNVFKNTFYYSQLPSRLLYTQFLFRCCGADGPDDYSLADKIGYPKSCFVGVDKYEDYFRAPKPVQYGCVVEVYKYSSYAMAVICGLTLIVWLLMIVHPIYFYVYELYICLMTPQLYPWVEEVNENTGIASGKRQE